MRRMNHDGEHAPIAVQIAGNDPGMMAEAAQFNVSRGAQIIDINMGCPKRRSARQTPARRCCAMRRSSRASRGCRQSGCGAGDAKTRTGWSPENRNAIRIAKIAEDAGIQALTLHGRTRACDFDDGTIEYDSIRDVKQSVAIPVVANGDIDSPIKVRAARLHRRRRSDDRPCRRGGPGSFATPNIFWNTAPCRPRPPPVKWPR